MKTNFSPRVAIDAFIGKDAAYDINSNYPYSAVDE